jgi:hypothetical protein
MARTRKKTRNITKLPSGRFRIRWTDERGARRTATHDTPADAELPLKRAQVEAEERRRGLRKMRPVDVRLRDVWNVWRREVGERKRSAVTDVSLWTDHLGPEFGDLGVADIDSGRIAAIAVAMGMSQRLRVRAPFVEPPSEAERSDCNTLVSAYLSKVAIEVAGSRW